MRRSINCWAGVLLGLLGLSFSARLDGQAGKPSPDQYSPHIFIRKDSERYRILRVDTSIWRDGRKSGIPLRQLSGLPDHCWAMKYTFVWNDESPSRGTGLGRRIRNQ